MTCLAIDADSLIYKACFIAEKTEYHILPRKAPSGVDYNDYDSYAPHILAKFRYVQEYKDWCKENNHDVDDFKRLTFKDFEPVSVAMSIIDSLFRGIISKVQPEQCIVYLSGDNNFREKVATLRPYKEARKDKPKPFYFEQIKKYVIDKWNAILVDGIEADDAVAMVQYASLRDDDHSVIASIDKDLKGVPGWNYNFDTEKFTWISLEDATRFFYTQLLMGDSTDSIPGCKGIGEKKAPQLLKDCKNEWEMYQVAVAEYDKAYGNGKDNSLKVSGSILIEQARLLYMLRDKGVMWTPPEKPNDSKS